MNDFIFVLVLVGIIFVGGIITLLNSMFGYGSSRSIRWTKPDGSTDYERHDHDCRIINGVHIPDCYGVEADYKPEMWGNHLEYDKGRKV